MPDKTKPAILTVYFYNPVDAVDLDVSIRMKLEEKYANKPEFTHKINYSSKGWQYIGHKDPTIELICHVIQFIRLLSLCQNPALRHTKLLNI
jgi:hypothetical protein